jgi:Domain of Unknown Function with PDB structure (DUF3857)/Transglutaminase-like superfamily
MSNKSFCKAVQEWTPAITSSLCVVALWLTCPGGALAGAPEWVRAAAQKQISQTTDNAEAAVLFDEQITTVSESGEIKTVYRRVCRILRPEGRNRRSVGVYFDDETRLTYLKGWSILPGGRELEVKEKDAIDTGAFSETLYQDTRYRVLRLPSAEPGNVIGYEYEQRRRPAILQNLWNFQQDVPVLMSRFELRLPAGWEYKTAWLNHAAVEPRSTGNNRWAWELTDLPAVEPEPGMPHWRVVAGWMGVAFYGHYTGDQRYQSSWRDIGLWYAGLAGDRSKASAAIRQKVTELTATSPASLDKVRALTAFVQKDVRYVAIEIGIGGFRPHSAEEVFTNRYGDCKDKATLLRSMLAEIGVHSYYVLINSDRGAVSPEFPTALSFDHVILAIALPAEVPRAELSAVEQDAQRGTLLYFDPTDAFVPLGILPEGLQMNHGLLVSESGGELRLLPLMAPALNGLMRNEKLVLLASGAIRGAVTETRSGAMANNLRARLLSATVADRTKDLESFLGTFIGSIVLQSSHVENLENHDRSLVVQYSFEAPGYAKAAGDLLLIRPRVLGGKSEDLFDSRSGVQRKYPVEFSSTSVQSDRVEIALPAGYAVDEIPAPLDLNTSFGEYHSRCEVKGTVLSYTRSYQINALRVPAEQWGEVIAFSRRIAANERKNAVLKQAGR